MRRECRCTTTVYRLLELIGDWQVREEEEEEEAGR
jgi:hypothetical protein